MDSEQQPGTSQSFSLAEGPYSKTSSLDARGNALSNPSISVTLDEGEFEEFQDTHSGEEEEEDGEDAFEEAYADADDEHKRMAGVMAMNYVYLELVDKMIAKVDRAIDKNRELQQAVKSQLTSSRRSLENNAKSLGSMSGCYPPYFKDSFGMMPNRNLEILQIAAVCNVDPLMSDDRTWRKEELLQLKEGVKDSILTNKTIPLISRKNLIAEKMMNAGAETSVDQKHQWRAQIEQLNRRIIYLRQRSEAEILAGQTFEDVDWARICSQNFRGIRSVTQLRMKWCNEVSPKFSKEPWTEEEEHTLTELTQRPWINWDVVADQLGTSRTPFHCFEHFHLLRSQMKDRKPWSTAEDEKLMSLVQTLKVGDEINWYKVASYIPDRTKYQCEHRYRRSLDRTIKHGRWAVAEDLLLLKEINKYGPQDWQRIAQRIPNRSALQCRDRWINVLDSKRRNKPWLWEEHLRLLFGVRIFGRNNFAKIALLLPGRNNADVKARIMALIRYKIMIYEAQVENREMPEYKVVQSSFLFFKDRRDMVLSKFREFTKEGLAEDDAPLRLNARMGIGSFVLTSTGDQADYSDSKLNQQTEFGRVVNKSGRWAKLIKNPNEYGSEELNLEIRKLPAEQGDQLTKFLRESDIRLAIEMNEENMCPDEDPEKALKFYEAIITPDRLEELRNLLDEVLPIQNTDVIRHSNNRLRPPKPLVVKPASATHKPKRIRKRKAPVMELSLMAPKRHTMQERLVDELQQNLKAVNPEDRRSFMIRNMCQLNRKSDDTAAMERYQREGLKKTGFLAIETYLRERLRLNTHSTETRPHKPAKVEPVEEEDPQASTSYPTTAPHTQTQFSLGEALASLLPPTTATINGVSIYKTSMRMALTKIANQLFDPVQTGAVPSIDAQLDIQLPGEVVNSPLYAELKTIMYRMFFLPLMMQEAIKQAAPAETFANSGRN